MAEKSIRYLKGVGEKRAKYFEKLGITTVDSLASLLPRRYENLGKIVDIGALRFCRGDLSAKLRTYRPASACYHDNFSFDGFENLIKVNVNFISA